MKVHELAEHVEHCRARFLQDALAEATADYWRHRAQAFRDAQPREGDYPGRATPEQIEAQRWRLAEVELACARRAVFMLGGGVE